MINKEENARIHWIFLKQPKRAEIKAIFVKFYRNLKIQIFTDFKKFQIAFDRNRGQKVPKLSYEKNLCYKLKDARLRQQCIKICNEFNNWL